VPIRVLLVDDVVEVRRLVRTALRFRGVFSVVGEAAGGAEAIEAAGRLRPDIVVLDIGLPDIAGQDVLTGIRTAAPDAKVVIYSGTAPDESAGLAEVVEGYALKDSELDYLVELLEELGHDRVGEMALRLPASVSSARDARTFARTVLDGWKVPDIVDDALLVVSEMVANAVTHAGTECELRIFLSSSAVRVEVADRGDGTPDPKPPSLTRNSGRGLHLIDAVSAAWGVEPDSDGGKTVWAELRRRT
jgi:CheY-like chemotaxis protein